MEGRHSGWNKCWNEPGFHDGEVVRSTKHQQYKLPRLIGSKVGFKDEVNEGDKLNANVGRSHSKLVSLLHLLSNELVYLGKTLHTKKIEGQKETL